MKAYWITWEDHRRSRELATAIGAEYVALLHPGKRYSRYPILAVKTIRFLLKNKSQLVFCQNPSIVLTALLCTLKLVLRYKLIVDRHSNFKFPTLQSTNPKWMLFHWLSDFTLRIADLTIVTNEYLKNLIDSKRGHGFVLQDKLPELTLRQEVTLKGEVNFVFVSTFSDDEPITEIIDAARHVDPNFHVYITGGYRKYVGINSIISTLPPNVTLTGFLPEAEYQSLLYSADVIIVITDMEHTLTCGSYEAVSLEKPMILGGTSTIKEYFFQGAVYTHSQSSNIASSMNEAVATLHEKEQEVIALRSILIADWQERFDLLIDRIEALSK